MREAKDPVEFSRLQDRSEKLEKHNQTLKEELEKADKENLKTTYNSYFCRFKR